MALVIFCVTDERNATRPQILTAATIGLTVPLIISLLGPLTMAGLNPARSRAAPFFLARRLAERALHRKWGRLADRLPRRAALPRSVRRRHLSRLLPRRLSRLSVLQCRAAEILTTVMFGFMRMEAY